MDEIKLSQDQFDQITYFIDDWLRFQGFGGEYNKLVKLAVSLRESGVDFSKRPYICHALRIYDSRKQQAESGLQNAIKSQREELNKVLSSVLQEFRDRCSSDEEFSRRMSMVEAPELGNYFIDTYLFDDRPVFKVLCKVTSEGLTWTITRFAT